MVKLFLLIFKSVKVIGYYYVCLQNGVNGLATQCNILKQDVFNLDYAQAIGLELDYRPKHVLVNGIDSLELTLDDRARSD